MIRYAIYTRQSVEKLADVSSWQAQFQTCQEFVAALKDAESNGPNSRALS